MKASTGGMARRPKRTSARVFAEHFRSSGSQNRQPKATTEEASAFTPSSAVRTRQMPSNSYTLISFTLELAFFLSHQTFQFVQQLAIALTDSIDDAGQHRLNSVGAVFEETFDDVGANAVFKFFR